MKQPELLTLPGGIDLHVHLREPGTSSAETIASGTRAALLGGFALVCDMPNNPGRPTWDLARIKEKHDIIRDSAFIPVATYAGAQPEADNVGELERMSAESIGLKIYGAITTGTERDYEADDFMEAVSEWHKHAPEKPVMLHSGEENLADFIALIAEGLDQPLHVCHVNSPADVKLVSEAKAKGLPVTCGVCPHHLLKTSHDVNTQGWYAEMKPPLVHQDRAEELMSLLASGEIDIVETDHAPHSFAAKDAAEEENPLHIYDGQHRACFGVPGVDFALPLLFYQAKRGQISMDRLVEAISMKPAEIIGVKVTKATSVTWRMEQFRIENEKSQVESKTGWTPYLGMLAVGKIESMKIGGTELVRGRVTKGRKPRVISRRGSRL